VEGLTTTAPRGRTGPAVIVLAAAFLFGACSAETAAPSASEPPALTPIPVVTPAATPSDSAGSQPPSDDPNATPSDDPNATPGDPYASPSPTPGAAAACSGTEGNRAFYVNVADHVQWNVYCAVLPKGWIVEAGSFRTTSSGGWMKIAYKASGSRHFELREGAFCTDPATCVPTGTELAPGSFGDRQATILQVEDGGFAALVNRGEKLQFAAIGKGMDEATFRAYAGALILVGD
jgi:hypothetical protein